MLMGDSLYIDLLKKTLTDLHREKVEYKPLISNYPSWKLSLLQKIDKVIRNKKIALCRVVDFNAEHRINGLDWPSNADTMIGLKRLENIEFCVSDVIKNNVPGDLIETGVWRGGATIFMRALLKVANDTSRTVWVADSFEGLPKPNEDIYEADKDDPHHLYNELRVSLEDVKRNFEKYGLLDDQVRFLKGWFKDTLPNIQAKQFAVVRLDGDMYESTMDGLVNLYPKLSVGGYLIVDDWGAVKACQQAVIDYRKAHGISEEIITIDQCGVYWKKLNETT
jgi:O-methyltransferase